MARVAPDATAYAHRNGQPSFLIVARWADPAEAEREIAWARAYWAAMQPYVEQAAYPNYLEAGAEGAERVRAAYGGNYERLTRVKAAYDPTNFFRGNQNIPPACNGRTRMRLRVAATAARGRTIAERPLDTGGPATAVHRATEGPILQSNGILFPEQCEEAVVVAGGAETLGFHPDLAGLILVEQTPRHAPDQGQFLVSVTTAHAGLILVKDHVEYPV